ncbi:hypothetical protein Pfo_002617 [Paulownia fortunei]|nr:hypothetical protein Pfo_002617 [Paulownia fortunei]
MAKPLRQNVVWVLVLMLVAIAEATPPGIANNPSHARCMIKKYKHCYNLEHVCPKFCPDTCTVECVSCKPICGDGSTAPPPDSESPPPPEEGSSPPKTSPPDHGSGDEGKSPPPSEGDNEGHGGKGAPPPENDHGSGDGKSPPPSEGDGDGKGHGKGTPPESSPPRMESPPPLTPPEYSPPPTPATPSSPPPATPTTPQYSPPPTPATPLSPPPPTPTPPQYSPPPTPATPLSPPPPTPTPPQYSPPPTPATPSSPPPPTPTPPQYSPPPIPVTPSSPPPPTPTPPHSSPSPPTPTPSPPPPTPTSPPSYPPPSTSTSPPPFPPHSSPSPPTPTPSPPPSTPTSPPSSSPPPPTTPSQTPPSSPPQYSPPPTPTAPTPSPPLPTPSSPSPPPSPSPSFPTPSTPTSTPPTSPTPGTPPATSPTPPSSPGPVSPSPPTSVPTPPSDSSEAAGGRRKRCKNRNYPQCYGSEHVCPSSCPSTCEVDCVTCKPVCKCDMPGAVCQDPRFIGGDGITFYFHGKKDQDFCLVTEPNLHVNAHFIGRRNENMKRDFTWVQSIGILFGDHQLFVGAQKTATWNDANDRLSLAFDGEPIVLPSTEGSTWQPSALPSATMKRDSDTNSVIIEVDGLFKISAKVVPITQHESKVHNYGITEDDCFAHLELGFKFFSLSGTVNGVLGQTYRNNYVSRVKMGVPMPVLGGETEFAVSSLFATNCAVSQFRGGKLGPGHDQVSALGLELPSMKCGSGIDGRGVVCKR